MVFAALLVPAGGYPDLLRLVGPASGNAPVVVLDDGRTRLRAAKIAYETPADLARELRSYFAFRPGPEGVFGFGGAAFATDATESASLPSPEVSADGTVTTDEAGLRTTVGAVWSLARPPGAELPRVLQGVPIWVRAKAAKPSALLPALCAAAGMETVEDKLRVDWSLFKTRWAGAWAQRAADLRSEISRTQPANAPLSQSDDLSLATYDFTAEAYRLATPLLVQNLFEGGGRRGVNVPGEAARTLANRYREVLTRLAPAARGPGRNLVTAREGTVLLLPNGKATIGMVAEPIRRRSGG
jgi:hypothetical protein